MPMASLPDNSLSFFKWNDGTKTETVPLILHRPAHCSSCSILNGKPTTMIYSTPVSSPVPAHDVPMMMWADLISVNDTESLLRLVTIHTRLQISCQYNCEKYWFKLKNPDPWWHIMVSYYEPCSPLKSFLYLGTKVFAHLDGCCNDNHLCFICNMYCQSRSMTNCCIFTFLYAEVPLQAFPVQLLLLLQ